MKKAIIYKIFTGIFCMLFLLSCNENGIVENGTGMLTGTVVSDGDNLPLANVKISSTPTSNTVFTGEDGTFEIDPISTGDFSIKAELDDYTTGFEAATILEGESTNVVFELSLSSDDNVAPLAPVLVFPADNAQEIMAPVEFLWISSSSDEDEIEYTFELRNGATNEMVASEVLQDTTFTVEELPIGVSYFWQVTANDNLNPPVASAISSFQTIDGTDNRFFYVRNMDGSNVIFSGSDTPGNDNDSNPNENEIQLTSSSQNSFRPRLNRAANKIAFLRTVGSETHLFTMDIDGTNVRQITNGVPVAGFRLDEVDFAWHANGSRIYYPNFNKLYSININDNDLDEIYSVAQNMFITEIDGNELNNLIAIKTNNVSGYEARIFVINPDTGMTDFVVVENLAGALGGIDYSIDGSTILYTRDVDGFETPAYRQLDSRIFEFDTATSMLVDLSANKQPGTNDLDARYSPDEGKIIFYNASSDGVTVGNINTIERDTDFTRELLFTNAFMPDWE